TTPRTERTTAMSCVIPVSCGIAAQGIRPSGARYADRAGVAELVRRARLKIGWPSGRAGSSPAPGIAESSQTDDRLVPHVWRGGSAWFLTVSVSQASGRSWRSARPLILDATVWAVESVVSLGSWCAASAGEVFGRQADGHAAFADCGSRHAC